MATSNGKTRVRRGLEVMECYWGHIYTGTEDELIATGNFRAEWFSREMKPGRYCFKQVVEGREIAIVRRSKFRFDAHWNFTEAERAQYEEVESQRKAADNFNRAVACLPKSALAFKASFVRKIQVEAQVFLEFAGPKGEYRGGFLFAEHSLSAIEDAFDDLIEAIDDASVVYSEADRQRGAAALRLKYCGDNLDPAACKFVDRLRQLPAVE